jgi:cysteine desulfurase/selenocysteine lyase
MKTTFDVDRIRSHFPILNQKVRDHQLVYFDNGATSQHPLAVTDAVSDYYNRYNSNVHRGVHHLSQVATQAMEDTRRRVARFINATHPHEVIFTRGTTEAINLVAFSFGQTFLKPGDEILLTALEHHSNIVPWQMACQRTGAILKVIPVNPAGEIDPGDVLKLIGPRTRLVTLAHVSNALGTINPVKEITRMAHQHNIPVLVDGAQAVPHLRVDMQEIGCDFYAFSGHKMYAPMGIGVLYGREEWLNRLEPWQGGGEMIETVTFEKTTYNQLPYKFEAGTPDVAGIIGMGAAIAYLADIGFDEAIRYEEQLLHYATQTIGSMEGVTLVGTAREKTGVLSFLIDNVHPYDAGTIIDHFGIAVRTGHHCAQPLMDHLKIPGTIRASFSFYNTMEEVDRLVEAIMKVKEMFI